MNEPIVDCRNQPISVGDTVAWGTSDYGNRVGIGFGTVVKLHPLKRDTSVPRVTVRREFTSRGAADKGTSVVSAVKTLKVNLPFVIVETP